MKPAASIAVIMKPAASIAVIVKSAASIAVISPVNIQIDPPQIATEGFSSDSL